MMQSPIDGQTMADAQTAQAPRPKRWQFSLKTLLIVMMVASVVFGLVGRMYHKARIESRRVNNLKLIGLALWSYNDTWRCFPPAYLADSNGRPMHSWRVLILPYLEHVELYEKYDFNEPWDGPNNCLLADQMPDCFRSPLTADAGQHETVYVAMLGDDTMWPGPKGRRLQEVRDGTSNTVHLLETIHKPVHWMSPIDADYEQALESLKQECHRGGNSLDFSRYRVLLTDGSVHTIGSVIAEELQWYFLVDDGEVLWGR